MNGNYPAGTSASDPRAPWNQPEIELDDDALLEFIEDVLLGDLIYEDEDLGRWLVEAESGEMISEIGGQPFLSRYDAEAYLLCERYSWLDEQAVEQERERRADAAFDGDY